MKNEPEIFIDPNALFYLKEEEEKGELKWTGELVSCCNCKNKEAEGYKLFNSGSGKWESHYYYCSSCGYDSWARAINDFNEDLNFLGGV